MSAAGLARAGSADVLPDDVLKVAMGRLQAVAVCGLDQDGALYVASSVGRAWKTLELLKMAERDLVDTHRLQMERPHD